LSCHNSKKVKSCKVRCRGRDWIKNRHCRQNCSYKKKCGNLPVGEAKLRPLLVTETTHDHKSRDGKRVEWENRTKAMQPIVQKRNLHLTEGGKNTGGQKMFWNIKRRESQRPRLLVKN